MIIKLDLKSKNLNSIHTFLRYFYKLNTNAAFSKNLDVKRNNKLLKKVLFSILKSPHVNKNSQEQFEIKIYNTFLVIYTKNYLKVLVYLKLLLSNFFPDVGIKVNFLVNTNHSNNIPYNFNFKSITSSYLNYLDLSGEKLFIFVLIAQ